MSRLRAPRPKLAALPDPASIFDVADKVIAYVEAITPKAKQFLAFLRSIMTGKLTASHAAGFPNIGKWLQILQQLQQLWNVIGPLLGGAVKA